MREATHSAMDPIEYKITPVPKPRMSQRDKWRIRKCVAEYWAFRDLVKLSRVRVPESGAHIVFYIPMPKSWGTKKRREMNGKPHKQKPDLDNLVKGLLDAIYDDDCVVWKISAEKRWADKGKIEVGSFQEPENTGVRAARLSRT